LYRQYNIYTNNETSAKAGGWGASDHGVSGKVVGQVVEWWLHTLNIYNYLSAQGFSLNSC
jgi:hypothetical protein